MTTSTTARRATALAAFVLSAPLVLSACGGSGDAAGESGGNAPGTGQEAPADQDVYEFINPMHRTVGAPLEVRIPEALKETAGADFDGLLVSSMTLTPRELDSAANCAVDVDVAYTDDSKAVFEAPGQTEDEYVAEQQERFDEAFQQALHEALRYASWDEMVLDLGEQEAVDLMRYEFLLFVTPQGTLDIDAVRANFVEVTPRDKALSSISLDDGAMDLDELDASAPETGVYASDDASSVTIVRECATSTDEDDTAYTLELPRSDDESSSGFEDAASFAFTVMKSGDIGILDGDVVGYEADANGDWIAS